VSIQPGGKPRRLLYRSEWRRRRQQRAERATTSAKTKDSKSSQKVQILGIGVALFSAICTVLAALITAGFFIGRATATGATCQDFFQPLINYLSAPEPPGQPVPFLKILIGGNRAGANPFVLFVYSNYVNKQGSALEGLAIQNFSDRIAAGGQPFDMHAAVPIRLSIEVPNGPITFTSTDSNELIAKFSTLECRDNGLLVATSDFDPSIIVVDFVRA
jgi:hypothetical protein